MALLGACAVVYDLQASLKSIFLGEMYSQPSNESDSPPYQLPRDTGIAYAAQESWVFNATIRVSR